MALGQASTAHGCMHDAAGSSMWPERAVSAAAALSSSRTLRGLLVIGITFLVILIFQVTPQLRGTAYRLPVLQPNSLRYGETVWNKATSYGPRLVGPEQFRHVFKLGGALFDEHGKSDELSTTITSCLVHSFSPQIEKDASQIFIDPTHQNIFFANSPAVTWFRGELVLVARIWLNREKHRLLRDWPVNDFCDNYLYTQKFNQQLEPISNGTIMGVPTPKQWVVGDGPIEPRVFVVQGRLIVSFNVAMAYSWELNMDNTVLWDYEAGRPIFPQIRGGSPMKNISVPDAMPRDKHWMALKQHDELYFVYNLDPLRVLQCRLDGFCWFVYSDIKPDEFAFKDHEVHLRGGTPFELYKWPYYVAVAHSTLFKTLNNHRYYTAHLVVLCVDPYRVVYVSEDLQIHPNIYAHAPIVREQWIDDDFIFPVGLILETADRLTVGVHVNDYSSVLVRFKGLRVLMQSVIVRDAGKPAVKGPPARQLHRYILTSQERRKNITFFYH